ncbi:MAG: PKD domain-containing protein [Thermoplasmata archaeon]|nr:PKD domain-containing protein [Thermoplasmata archaeon]
MSAPGWRSLARSQAALRWGSVLLACTLALPLLPLGSSAPLPVSGVPGSTDRGSPIASAPARGPFSFLPRALGAPSLGPIPGGNWVNDSNLTSPSSRSYPAMAWDPASNSLILYGGCPPTGKYYSTPCSSVIPESDTWSWNASTMSWTKISVLAGVSQDLGGAAMTWDAADQYLVRFGGMELNAAGFDLGTGNTTWTYSSSNWTQLHPATSPPRRFLAGMTFVPGPGGNISSGYVLMFGGLSCRTTCATGTYLNDTWEYSGGVWTDVTNQSASPSARAGAGLVYDASIGAAVLFGGENASGSTLNDTWVWNATTSEWTNLTASSSGPDLGPVPPAVSLTDYNSSEGGYPLLYASLNDTLNTANQSVWEFTDSRQWVPVETPAADLPPVREGAGLTYDDAAHGAVLFGGLGLNGVMEGFNQTYVYRDFVAIPSVAPAVVDLGQPMHFNATVYGNRSPPNQFLWQFGAASTSSDQNLSHVYASPGEYVVNLRAEDSGWGGGFDTVNRSVNVTVNPELALVRANVTPSDVDLGQTTTLTIATFGGTEPFSYAYLGLPPGCPLRNASTLLCTPTQSGAFSVSFWVNDTLGESVSGVVYVNVSTALGATFSTLPSVVDVGQNVTFTTTPNGGGALPLDYQYGALPGGCLSEDLMSFTCQVNTSGLYNVTLNLTDGGGGRIQLGAVLTINPDPQITTFTSSKLTIELGQSINLTVVEQGGTGPLTTSYPQLPPGCQSSNVLVLDCTPSATGTFALSTRVSDGTGASGVAPVLSLTVFAPLTISAFTALPRLFDLGHGTTLDPTAAGGQAPYVYAYSDLPSGCSSSNVPELRCVPTDAGTVAVRTVVTDALGVALTASVTVQVNPGLVLTGTWTTTPAVVGGNLTLEVNTSGGLGPFDYSYRNLPSGCTTTDGAAVMCHPSAVGNFSWSATVNDSYGGSVNASGTIHVASATGGGVGSTTPASGSSSTWLWEAGLAIALIAVVLLVAFWLRKGGPGPSNSGSPTPDGGKRSSGTESPAGSSEPPS